MTDKTQFSEEELRDMLEQACFEYLTTHKPWTREGMIKCISDFAEKFEMRELYDDVIVESEVIDGQIRFNMTSKTKAGAEFLDRFQKARDEVHSIEIKVEI